MGRQPIDIGPFHKGVNLIDPVLDKDELESCLNTRLGVRGNSYKRPGHSTYGNNPAKINGDALVNFLLRYYRADGTKKLIGAAGGKLRFGDDVTGAWTDISINGSGASMHATNLVDYTIYKNRLYLADGTNPQRYNGTDDIYAGFFSHAAPTAVAAAGANLGVGTYKYRVASVAGDMGEGPYGAETSIVIAGGPNQAVNLSVIDNAPAKYEETAKNIYRTKVNGSVFYLLTQIPAGTTVYADTVVTDATLGQQYISVHTPPADARFVITGYDDRTYWFGRAGVNASLVDVSDVGFPDRILDSDFTTVANNDGDILTGGGLCPAGIVFFKRNSAWLLRAFNSPLANLQPKSKRGAGVGSTSPFSIVTTPVGLIFMSQRGEIYKFDGANVDEIGQNIITEFAGMTQNAMSAVMACYHDYRYIISYDWRGSRGYNWKTLEYDIRTGKWEGPHYNADLYTPSYYAVFDTVLDKGELYWGEARAAAGSFVYGRTEFTKTDRGNKFISTLRFQLSSDYLGDIKSKKIFILGKISQDAILSASHLDDNKAVTGVVLNTPISIVGSKWNDGSNLGPGSNVAKFGSVTTVLFEGSFGPSARANSPSIEISDGGTSTVTEIQQISALVEILPPK
jgi:hypothetical protein